MEILPFAPVDGPDHRFGQINKPLDNDAYKLAGIEGFLPKQPWKSFAPQPFDDSVIPTVDVGSSRGYQKDTYFMFKCVPHVRFGEVAFTLMF
jgi:hypothetical protein